MKLKKYLEQFNNIAWYPSSNKDFRAMACLSHKLLIESGIPKADLPDCFIFTDYLSNADYEENYRFFLDLDEFTVEAKKDNLEDYKATIYNVKELEKLKIGFDPEMTAFGNDRYYGRVFTADVLVEHETLGEYVAKLVYVVAENTKFAFDFLIKNNIKVTYAIHSCYGHGFGCGRSNGSYMLQVLEDLGVKYLVSDMEKNYVGDDADKYLSEEQKTKFPILMEVLNYSAMKLWYGYSSTILYKVIGFKKREPDYSRGRFLFEWEVEYGL